MAGPRDRSLLRAGRSRHRAGRSRRAGRPRGAGRTRRTPQPGRTRRSAGRGPAARSPAARSRAARAGLAVAGLAVAGLPLPGLAVAGLPLRRLAVAGLAVGRLAERGGRLAGPGLPIPRLPVAGLPVARLAVSGLPGGGLARRRAGRPLGGRLPGGWEDAGRRRVARVCGTRPAEAEARQAVLRLVLRPPAGEPLRWSPSAGTIQLPSAGGPSCSAWLSPAAGSSPAARSGWSSAGMGDQAPRYSGGWSPLRS